MQLGISCMNIASNDGWIDNGQKRSDFEICAHVRSCVMHLREAFIVRPVLPPVDWRNAPPVRVHYPAAAKRERTASRSLPYVDTHSTSEMFP